MSVELLRIDLVVIPLIWWGGIAFAFGILFEVCTVGAMVALIALEINLLLSSETTDISFDLDSNMWMSVVDFTPMLILLEKASLLGSEPCSC